MQRKMKNLKTFRNFLFFTILASCVHTSIGSGGLQECMTREGIPGKCRPLPDCVPVQKTKKHTPPTICSEESFFAIVCCPKMSYREKYKYWKLGKKSTEPPSMGAFEKGKRYAPQPSKSPKATIPPSFTAAAYDKSILVPLPSEEVRVTIPPSFKPSGKGIFISLPPKDERMTIPPSFMPSDEGILIPLPPKDERMTIPPSLTPSDEGILIPLPPKDKRMTISPSLTPPDEGILIPLPPKDERMTIPPSLMPSDEGILIPLPPKDERMTIPPPFTPSDEGILIPLPSKGDRTTVPTPFKTSDAGVLVPGRKRPGERKIPRKFNLPSCGVAPNKRSTKSQTVQQEAPGAFPRVKAPYRQYEGPGQRFYNKNRRSGPHWSEHERPNPYRRRRLRREATTSGVQYIVGGRTSEDDAWPWMAAIYTINLGRRVFKCGGTIISNKYILTAAHCFKTSARPKEIRGEYFVRVGLTDLSDFNSGFEFGVKKIILHEEFKPPSFYNDIALLEIDGDTMSVDPSAHPACLPPQQEADQSHLEFKIATILGWGSVIYAGRDSNKLNEVDIPVTTNSYCNESYSSIKHLKSYPEGITSRMLCAGYKSGGKDACQGDSGGPLLMLDNNRRWTLQGIISGGFQCARPGFPGIYTRVSAYSNWIIKNMS